MYRMWTLVLQRRRHNGEVRIMGFFTNFGEKLTNLIKGKGFKDNETINKTKIIVEEVPEPTKIIKKTKRQKEQEVDKIKEEIEEEEEETKQEREEREKTLKTLPREAKTEKAKEAEKEEEMIKEWKDETDIISEKAIPEGDYAIRELPAFTERPSESYIHSLVNQRMEGIMPENEVFASLNNDANYYYGIMRGAIVGSGAKIDEEIASLIVANSERFRSRFSTRLIIDLTTEKGEEETISMMCLGNTPINIAQAIEMIEIEKENGVRMRIGIGETIDGSGLNKAIYELKNRLEETGKVNIPHPDITHIDGSARINNIRMGVHFG